MDTKRNAFPRFFFISDDELLSVLGSSDPTTVQEHMLKMFDNCAALKFGDRNKTVIGMRSSEGETYDLRDHDYKKKQLKERKIKKWLSGS